MIGGIGQFEMGEYHFNHVFDGYGRIHQFHLEPGSSRPECIYSARMMPTQAYQKAKKAGRIVAGFKFEDTVPSLNASIAENIMGPFDNTYVQQTRFGDGYWSTTDNAMTWKYTDVFGKWEGVKWEDHLALELAVTHVIVNPRTGRLYGLGSQLIGVLGGHFTIYEVDPAAPAKRINLVSFKPKHGPSGLPYEHSFGLGTDFAVICGHPFSMSATKLLSNSGLLGSFDLDKSGNTTFYLVNLTTKAVEEFVAPPYLIFHFANIHTESNGDVVFVQPTMTCNAYNMFHIPTVMSTEALDHLRDDCENQLRRFTLHRSGPQKGKVSTEVLNSGWQEFPMFNELWRGKVACYQYNIEWYHAGSPHYATMALVKNNVCNGTRLASWSVSSHYPGEPRFVARPGATEEDDGVIVSVVMDGVEQASYLLILDARTFTPLEEFDVGLRVPATLHGNWAFADSPLQHTAPIYA